MRCEVTCTSDGGVAAEDFAALLLARMSSAMRMPMMNTAATPPATPPAIAATLDPLVLLLAVCDAVAADDEALEEGLGEDVDDSELVVMGAVGVPVTTGLLVATAPMPESTTTGVGWNEGQ